MKRGHVNHRKKNHSEAQRAREDVARREFDLWAEPGALPDLTERVMRRLGYERAEAAAVRRERRRRNGNRCAIALLLIGVAAFGLHLHQLERQSRRATIPSFEAAIPASIRTGTETVNDAARTFRNLLNVDQSTESEGGASGRSNSAEQVGRIIHCSRVRWSGLL